MSLDKNIEYITNELRTKHGCHTVILYGSRSRGEENPASDYDLLGIKVSGEAYRDARVWNGAYLDLFIYPESKILNPDETQLHFRGKVLCEKDNIGTNFLARLEEIFNGKPKPLPVDEIQALRVWADKAVARIRAGGIQGDFRRAEFIPVFLADFFGTRRLWYRGPKEGLHFLAENHSEIHDLFVQALKPTASIEVIEKLVSTVWTEFDSKKYIASNDGSQTPSVIPISMKPIGMVHSSRDAAIDDHWDSVEASIVLDSNQFSEEAIAQLNTFSHIEVLFQMNQVSSNEVNTGARYPRGNTNWPKVGIFAQRAKNRPNQLGSTICEIKHVDGLSIHVKGLDAIDGTPVLDIKPYMKEFAPRGETRQPLWASELMKEYWK